MECPKCGKQLLPGEICACDGIAVYQREAELKKEKEEEQSRKQEEQAKKTAEKAEQVGKVADAADNVLKSMASFFSLYARAFLKKEKEKYSDIISTAEVAILYAMSIVLSALMVYMLLTKSVFSSVLVSFTLLAGGNKFSIFLLSLLITIFAEISAILLKLFLLKKTPAEIVRKACDLYLYTIPCMILVIAFSWLNILCVTFFMLYLTLWVLYGWEEMKKEKNHTAILFFTAQFFLVSMIGQILFSALI